MQPVSHTDTPSSTIYAYPDRSEGFSLTDWTLGFSLADVEERIAV